MVCCSFIKAPAQDEKPAYRIFTSEGEASTYGELLRASTESDIIFFGELHDSPIAHWLQMELARDLYSQKKKLVLGSEMFESDEQLVLDEYISGIISEKRLESSLSLWPNYSTDYRPLLRFARENSIPFRGTSVPGRYASMVFSGGFESLKKLDADARKYLPPLPIRYDPALKSYRAMAEDLEHNRPESGNAENLIRAQALKDATMAHFILASLKKGTVFLHINGYYHNIYDEGIIWYVRQKNPGLRITSIATVKQVSIEKLEKRHTGISRFIICTPSTMTETH